MKKVDLYTDGACSYNPGPGGWGVVLIYKSIVKEFSGSDEMTTNNKMELKAVIEGIRKLNQPCNVTIYTDSAYVHNAFELGWINNWQKNNWKTSNKKPVQNQDLWLELLEALKTHKATWVKVKGHSDNKYNNRCDYLATKAVADLIKKQTV